MRKRGLAVEKILQVVLIFWLAIRTIANRSYLFTLLSGALKERTLETMWMACLKRDRKGFRFGRPSCLFMEARGVHCQVETTSFNDRIVDPINMDAIPELRAKYVQLYT